MLRHEFELCEDRWRCSWCLVVRPAGRCGGRHGRAKVRCPGSRREGEVWARRPGMCCMQGRAFLLFCSRCCAYQQSLPRPSLVQRTSFLKRQAHVRLRRIYNGKHPTRSSGLSASPTTFGAHAHSVRTVVRLSLLVWWMVLTTLVLAFMLESRAVLPTFSVPTSVAKFDESDGSFVNEHDEESSERWYLGFDLQVGLRKEHAARATCSRTKSFACSASFWPHTVGHGYAGARQGRGCLNNVHVHCCVPIGTPPHIVTS